MKDFLTGIAPSSDGDLLHLSEGTTDFLGSLDVELDNKEEKNDDEKLY